MKVIDIKNIKMNSINQKFGYNPKTRKLYSNSEYKQFKACLINELNANHVNQIAPPYYVDIYMETYLDIDAPIKAILDALQEHGCIINDRDVLSLSVQKKQIKKGTKSSLQIVVETYMEDVECG